MEKLFFHVKKNEKGGKKQKEKITTSSSSTSISNQSAPRKKELNLEELQWWLNISEDEEYIILCASPANSM